MSLINWMDARLYPGSEATWDGKRFRGYILDKLREEYSVLDLGAGRGASTLLNFKGLVAFVAGVDPSPAVEENPFLDEAKILPLPEGRIPYPDNRFDIIITCDVIEHIENPTTFFGEAYRVLKPNGRLLAKTPNKRHYITVVARLTPHWFHEYINKKRGVEIDDIFPTFYKCNTPEDVACYAQRAGFEVEEIQMWEGRPNYLRFWAPAYLAGFVYERVANKFSVLSRFRCVMVFSIRKPMPDHPG